MSITRPPAFRTVHFETESQIRAFGDDALEADKFCRVNSINDCWLGDEVCLWLLRTFIFSLCSSLRKLSLLVESEEAFRLFGNLRLKTLQNLELTAYLDQAEKTKVSTLETMNFEFPNLKELEISGDIPAVIFETLVKRVPTTFATTSHLSCWKDQVDILKGAPDSFLGTIQILKFDEPLAVVDLLSNPCVRPPTLLHDDPDDSDESFWKTRNGLAELWAHLLDKPWVKTVELVWFSTDFLELGFPPNLESLKVWTTRIVFPSRELCETYRQVIRDSKVDLQIDIDSSISEPNDPDDDDAEPWTEAWYRNFLVELEFWANLDVGNITINWEKGSEAKKELVRSATEKVEEIIKGLDGAEDWEEPM